MKLVGHRGAKGEAPENTIMGIEHALKHGLRAIEIDVHLSLDRQFVVTHDTTLDRTTNHSGNVKDFDLLSLQKMRLEKNETIPSLRDIFNYLNSFEAPIDLFIEVKIKGAERELIDFLNIHKTHHRVFIKCFDHRVLLKISKVSQIPVVPLICHAPLTIKNILRPLKSNIISIEVSLIDEKLIDMFKRAGVKVFTWNVNSRNHLNILRPLEIDWICTDFPSILTSK